MKLFNVVKITTLFSLPWMWVDNELSMLYVHFVLNIIPTKCFHTLGAVPFLNCTPKVRQKTFFGGALHS